MTIKNQGNLERDARFCREKNGRGTAYSMKRQVRFIVVIKVASKEPLRVNARQ